MLAVDKSLKQQFHFRWMLVHRSKLPYKYNTQYDQCMVRDDVYLAVKQIHIML